MYNTIVIDLRMIEASGIGTYLKNIIPLIVNKKSKDFFKLIGKKEEIEKYQWAKSVNVEIVNCNSPIYSISEQWGLIKEIGKDISLFWSPHYNIPLIYKGKLLVTIHDVFHLAMPQFVNGMHRRLYAKFMFNALCNKANRIITVSKFTKSELLTFMDYSESDIHPIYNGVEESWFDIKKSDGFSNKPYLIYVGNVKPHKNLTNLLHAFVMIMHSVPHDLIIVGKKAGFLTDDLQAMELARNIGSRIKFTGYIDDDLLKQYVANAEALIFPSLYEGFGLPPLEAMACGCPTIVSNTASLPEVCGDAALYCDPYNIQDIAVKIKMILNNTELRETLRICGIGHAKQFSWKKCADEVRVVIEEMIANENSNRL